jgi:iron(III) transport system ATP-binding protein
MSFLELRSVGKHYGPVAALEGIDLAVESGGRTAIVGPSGSGKTTLVRLIAGFEAPDEGQIILAGAHLADGPRIVPAHRREIGVVAQEGALFPHLTIAENIGFGLGRAVAHRQTRIHELLEMVELDRTMLRRRPHELSGGQQQRVALARALARKPRLMLLDEPFSALDTGLREAMRKAVAAILREAGITTLLVTHDQNEAMSFADQVAVLRDGRLVQAGSPRELYLTPKDPMTAAFLGDVVLLSGVVRNGGATTALGTLPVPAGAPQGPAELMLRPDQLRIDSAAPAADGPKAVVASVEFGGGTSLVTIDVEGLDRPISIRVTGADLPAPGTCLRLVVAGTAHVFVPAA